MNDHKEKFSIRVEGAAVGAGRMRLASVVKLLGNINRALYRTGKEILKEEKNGIKLKGSLRENLAIDLVGYSEGSRAVVMKFDSAVQQVEIPETDFLSTIADLSFGGLDEAQGPGEKLSKGFSPSVLLAWRNVGHIFQSGVEQISIQYSSKGEQKTTEFTPKGYARILDRLLGAEINLETFEGRLKMADFKDRGSRLRIHPNIGDPIICLFDNDKEDDVLGNILKLVRITGPATKNLLTAKIESVKVLNIERISDEELTADGAGVSGEQIDYNFWHSHSLDDLHKIQGLPYEPNLSRVAGKWPGEIDDGFEDLVDAGRKLVKFRRDL